MTIYLFDKDGNQFHDIVFNKFSFSGQTMGFDKKISCDFLYPDDKLLPELNKGEYVVFRQEKYFLIKPPVLTQKGLLANAGEQRQMAKYNCEFLSYEAQLQNIPFTDVALPDTDESNYRHGARNWFFFGTVTDLVRRINNCLLKNAPSSGWTCKLQSGFVDDGKTPEEGVIPFNSQNIAQALQTLYNIYKVPFSIEGKNVLVGVPVAEIGHVFKFGQDLGLLSNDLQPLNNKVITRIAPYGAAKNVPYGYPIIKTFKAPYDVIQHSFYTNVGRLMLPETVDAIRRKVQYDAPDYDPNIEIKDYLDADITFPTPINPSLPLLEQKDFEDVYPTIKEVEYNGQRIDLIKNVFVPSGGWNSKVNTDTGELEQSTFEIELYPLGFDIYACASETGAMTLSVETGACMGCKFNLGVNWEYMNKNFWYVDEATGKKVFNPNLPTRDYNAFPNSTNQSIKITLFKDIETFGVTAVMPNEWQYPKSGDRFVLTEIALPQIYIDAAQNKLRTVALQFMRENNYNKFKYPLDVDSHFLAKNKAIEEQIWFNRLFVFERDGKTLKLPIQNITIQYGEALTKYQIEVTDDLVLSLNPIGQVSEGLRQTNTIIENNTFKGEQQARGYYTGLRKVEQGVFDSEGNNRINTVETLILKTNFALVGQPANNFGLSGGGLVLGLGEIQCGGGTLLHFDTSVLSEYWQSNTPNWNFQARTFTGLSADKDYYVYLQCNRTNNSAFWEVTDKAYKYDEDPNIYRFLWGQTIVVENSRMPFATYGLTATMGGHISTLTLQSPNFILSNEQFYGMFIDLLNAKIYMGDGAEIVTRKIIIREPNGNDLDVYENIQNTNSEITRLDETLQGVRPNHIESYDPDISNEPAKTWIANGEEAKHFKETFTNWQTGKSWWWWSNGSGIWGWKIIEDTDIEAALAAATAAKIAADKANLAISEMNDDNVFDIPEKQSIRTQWEVIQGASNTTNDGDSSGSYKKTIALAGNSVSTSNLTSLYTTLRTFLNSNELYTNQSKTGFSRSTMAANFKNYYNEEVAILDKVSKGYVDNLAISISNVFNPVGWKTNDVLESYVSASNFYTHVKPFGELTRAQYDEIAKAGFLTISFDYDINDAQIYSGNFIGIDFRIRYTDGTWVNPYDNPDGGSKISKEANPITRKGTITTVTTINKAKTIQDITSVQNNVYIRSLSQGTAKFTNFRWYAGSKDIGYTPTIKEQAESQDEKSALSSEIGGISTQGLVYYNKFDGSIIPKIGSNVASDVSGLTYSAGKIGQSAKFNGTRNYIQLDNTFYPSLTVSCWARLSSMSGTSQIYRQTYGTTLNYGYMIICYENGKLFFYFNDLGTSKIIYSTPNTYYNEWIHIVAHFGSNNQYLYINGVNMNIPKAIVPSSYVIFDKNIGANKFQNNDFLNGYLDEFMLFTRALTDDEVKKMYRYSSQNRKFNNLKANPPTLSQATNGDEWIPSDEPARTYTLINDVWTATADSTVTTIKGGIVTSGFVGVGQEPSGVVQLSDTNAGMNGAGTASNSVRFFAGAKNAGKTLETAPFRVLQDGSLFAENATMKGTVNANAGSFGSMSINNDGVYDSGANVFLSNKPLPGYAEIVKEGITGQCLTFPISRDSGTQLSGAYTPFNFNLDNGIKFGSGVFDKGLFYFDLKIEKTKITANSTFFISVFRSDTGEQFLYRNDKVTSYSLVGSYYEARIEIYFPRAMDINRVVGGCSLMDSSVSSSNTASLYFSNLLSCPTANDPKYQYNISIFATDGLAQLYRRLNDKKGALSQGQYIYTLFYKKGDYILSKTGQLDSYGNDLAVDAGYQCKFDGTYNLPLLEMAVKKGNGKENNNIYQWGKVYVTSGNADANLNNFLKLEI